MIIEKIPLRNRTAYTKVRVYWDEEELEIGLSDLLDWLLKNGDVLDYSIEDYPGMILTPMKEPWEGAYTITAKDLKLWDIKSFWEQLSEGKISEYLTR